MNAKEAAEVAHVTERTVRQWIAEGQVPATKVGREWDVSADAVLARARGQVLPQVTGETPQTAAALDRLTDHLDALEQRLARIEQILGGMSQQVAALAPVLQIILDHTRPWQVPDVTDARARKLLALQLLPLVTQLLAETLHEDELVASEPPARGGWLGRR